MGAGGGDDPPAARGLDGWVDLLTTPPLYRRRTKDAWGAIKNRDAALRAMASLLLLFGQDGINRGEDNKLLSGCPFGHGGEDTYVGTRREVRSELEQEPTTL